MSEAARKGVIRDQGYQPYAGEHTPDSRRLGTIAGRMLGQAVRSRWMIAMLIVCAFPGVIGAVVLYVQSKLHAFGFGQGSLGARYVYDLFVNWYGTLVLAFFTALYAGAATIADDAQAGAFAFYFSRPVTREQYLAGKLAAPFFLTLAVSTAPALLVAFFQLAIARSGAEAMAALPLPFEALAVGIVEAATLAAAAVAISSLSRSRSFARGGYAALVLLPDLLGTIFAHLTRSAWPMVFSITAHLDGLARLVLRIPIQPGDRVLPGWVSAVALAAVIAGSIALLRRRLRDVEVIGG